MTQITRGQLAERINKLRTLADAYTDALAMDDFDEMELAVGKANTALDAAINDWREQGTFWRTAKLDGFKGAVFDGDGNKIRTL